MKKRALIVIDVQESFRQRPIWAASSNPEIAKQVSRLAETFRANDEKIFWILHVEPGTGGVFDPALGFVRLIDGLVPADGEPVITKTSHNAFTTTNLQQQLVEAGIGEVVVCGIRTEQCVETTARVASDLGYAVTFVIDATATNPIEHRDAPESRSLDEILADPRTLGVEEILERTAYALSGRFATIATVEELTGK
ncbi:MAG: isochorismatase family protein [Hamadaea sp.]|uniref:cysteine hydrolase family protein n=1 Tax=Hamadaea sp. TaxID=2024425 RepID=UPI0017E6483C|nr:isochorismatase family protein [Hamadaea sp.]NUR69540.1 isochorismatase family protein [Hamadaea sp.]NUT20776.1 isochorismatase family protein [Hamadaea sp.]